MDLMRRALVLLIAAVAAIVLFHSVTCAGAGASMPSPPCAQTHVADAVDHLPEAVEAAVPFAALLLALLAASATRPTPFGVLAPQADARAPIGRGHPPPPLSATTARRLARLSLLLR